MSAREVKSEKWNCLRVEYFTHLILAEPFWVVSYFHFIKEKAEAQLYKQRLPKSDFLSAPSCPWSHCLNGWFSHPFGAVSPISPTLAFNELYVFQGALGHNRGFPDSSVGKESTCNAGDSSSIPGSGRSAGEGIDYPIQYFWASLVAQLEKNLSAMQETWVRSIPWIRERLHTPVFWPRGFHGQFMGS